MQWWSSRITIHQHQHHPTYYYICTLGIWSCHWCYEKSFGKSKKRNMSNKRGTYISYMDYGTISYSEQLNICHDTMEVNTFWEWTWTKSTVVWDSSNNRIIINATSSGQIPPVDLEYCNHLTVSHNNLTTCNTHITCINSRYTIPVLYPFKPFHNKYGGCNSHWYWWKYWGHTDQVFVSCSMGNGWQPFGVINSSKVLKHFSFSGVMMTAHTSITTLCECNKNTQLLPNTLHLSLQFLFLPCFFCSSSRFFFSLVLNFYL